MPVGSKIQPRNIGRFNGAAQVLSNANDIVQWEEGELNYFEFIVQVF